MANIPKIVPINNLILCKQESGRLFLVTGVLVTEANKNSIFAIRLERWQSG